MRILAIRGRNLASLAGDFVVDFEAEPLADAGIFAITGPTGAGKSTLLDAMCLALFGTLPRMSLAQTSARIETGQGDNLAADDPRLILRHGTGEGFAEVDFIARDGVPYRARWSVQRARKQPRGKLQNPIQSFQRLDTEEMLGSTRTETLGVIQHVVGLSADQFRRAVLLAQGDFDAFLRAKADERALLLERLTGSGIYARLGAAAYEKASRLQQQLQALDNQIADQNGLDDAARAAIEAEQTQVRAEAARLETELAVLAEARRWHARKQELAVRLAEAQAELERACAAQADAEARRQVLSRRQRAFELAHLWQEAEQQRMALAEARLRTQECTRVAEQAAVEVAEATDALRQAEQALAAIQAEERALAPEIDEARQLDRKLADLGQALAELEENRTRLALEMNAAQTQAETADSALRDAETQRAEHAAWLETHRYLARWEAQEAELVGQLREYGAVAEKLAETEQLRLKADTANREAQARLADAAAELARQEAQHRQAEADLADARAAAPGEEAFSALMEKRSSLQALQGLYANWQAKLVQVQQAADRHAGLLKEAETAAQELQAAEVLHAEISAELPVLQGMLEEARRTQRLVEAASGSHAELLRETLVDGEPCPVCGSRHHEQEALHAYVGAQVEEARSRTRELEADCAGRQQELAGLAERIKHTGVRRKQVQAQAEAEAQAVNDATSEAEALRDQIAGEAADLGLGAAEDGLGQQISACLKEADDACRCAVEGRKKAAEAQHAEEAARAKLEKVRATQQVAEEQARQMGQQQERLQETVVRLREEQERLANALNRVLGEHLDWQQQSDAVAAVQRQISSWRARDEACRAAEEALPALRQQLEDARAGASAAHARLDEVSTRCVDAGSERDRLKAVRGGLLSGATVEGVTARLEEARQAANARLEAARAREAAGMQNQAAALTRQQETARRCEELEEQVRQRCEDLHARLKEAGLDEAEVAAAARAGREVLQQEAEALAALDEAVIRAQAAVASRREDIERHDTLDQPEQTDEELAAEVEERASERQVVQERLKALEFDLRRDDEVRARTAALRAELERRREEARPWLELNEVIGDREGKRFRKFAQGLTLDRLLEHANARLAELSPRYTLERGQGGEMMIQVVDHDMAGEVRGVHNLSGGERFLVSLALALGLAEMSTGRGLRVESLFIDEGFGALDSASLGQALSVLEHLHASGRRVGVISHVEEVKERIPMQVMVTPIAKGRSQVEVGAA